jgi:hypothetical protein
MGRQMPRLRGGKPILRALRMRRTLERGKEVFGGFSSASRFLKKYWNRSRTTCDVPPINFDVVFMGN